MDELLPGMAAAPLHPMLVHFPIALWFTALPVWIYAVVKKSDGAWNTGRLMFELGTFGAIVAGAAGLVEANSMGHGASGHELVHTHRNFMLTAIAVAIAIVALERLWKSGRGRMMATGSALVLAGIVFIGADLGAHLVFGKGMGVSASGHHAAPEDGSSDHASGESSEHSDGSGDHAH